MITLNPKNASGKSQFDKLLRRISMCVVSVSICVSTPAFAQSDDFYDDGEYRRAVEDKDNVKEKQFTKKSRFELNLPNVGWILNTAFVDTYVIHGGVTYYRSEEWGFAVEGAMGINRDRDERKCLETFYNDPRGNVSEECGDGSGLDNQSSNYGPAYMPIREIKNIFAGNVVWTPVYGKQLLLLSATSYFDVFFTLGGGVIMSDYYAKRTELNNGRKPRAVYNADNEGKSQAECQQNPAACTLDGGARTDETGSYGVDGRPVVESQTHPFINIGIGQRFHFWKRFSIRFEFRDMLMVGTEDGIENYFALWGGLGARF
jgi:outer membrane beta-barrel protein